MQNRIKVIRVQAIIKKKVCDVYVPTSITPLQFYFMEEKVVDKKRVSTHIVVPLHKKRKKLRAHVPYGHLSGFRNDSMYSSIRRRIIACHGKGIVEHTHLIPIEIQPTDSEYIRILKETVNQQSAEIEWLEEEIRKAAGLSKKNVIIIKNIEHLTIEASEYEHWNRAIKNKMNRRRTVSFNKEPAEKNEETEIKVEPTQETIEATEETEPQNYIFNENQDYGLLDLRALRKWIKDHFIHHVKAKYEWFALWRVLKDNKLLVNGRTKATDYVRQMKEWYPNESFDGVEDAINIYKSGYLGEKSFQKWDDDQFRKYRKAKQAVSGYSRLYRLCMDLNEELKIEKLTTRRA